MYGWMDPPSTPPQDAAASAIPGADAGVRWQDPFAGPIDELVFFFMVANLLTTSSRLF